MEKRDLYDINRNLTGETIYKGDSIPDSKFILVVLSFMQNSKGEFLIQKRSVQKHGKYGSTGGHAKTGETSIQAMMTEINEEIGLNVNKDELNLFYSGRDDIDKVFFDLYYIKKDFSTDSLTLQEEEVESVKWMTVDEIKQLISTNEFLDSNVDEFYKILDYLNNN